MNRDTEASASRAYCVRNAVRVKLSEAPARLAGQALNRHFWPTGGPRLGRHEGPGLVLSLAQDGLLSGEGPGHVLIKRWR